MGVEREQKDEIGHLLSLLGFLIVIFAGLIGSFIKISDGLKTALVIFGIILLVAGVELVIRNRPENDSN